jgi:hypothetical protein
MVWPDLITRKCRALSPPVLAVFFSWGGTYVTRYCGHFWPILQPQMINEGDCGAIGGMKVGRGNRSTRRKPAPAPFCPPQIPRHQTRARTRATAMGSQRLTAWATARPVLAVSPYQERQPCYNYLLNCGSAGLGQNDVEALCWQAESVRGVTELVLRAWRNALSIM